MPEKKSTSAPAHLFEVATPRSMFSKCSDVGLVTGSSIKEIEDSGVETGLDSPHGSKSYASYTIHTALSTAANELVTPQHILPKPLTLKDFVSKKPDVCCSIICYPK